MDQKCALWHISLLLQKKLPKCSARLLLQHPLADFARLWNIRISFFVCLFVVSALARPYFTRNPRGLVMGGKERVFGLGLNLREFCEHLVLI